MEPKENIEQQKEIKDNTQNQRKTVNSKRK
jgi:hypothetical protein